MLISLNITIRNPVLHLVTRCFLFCKDLTLLNPQAKALSVGCPQLLIYYTSSFFPCLKAFSSIHNLRRHHASHIIATVTSSSDGLSSRVRVLAHNEETHVSFLPLSLHPSVASVEFCWGTTPCLWVSCWGRFPGFFRSLKDDLGHQ
jgi:hypothetical protein